MGVIAGGVNGVIGTAIWVAIAYYTDTKFGLVAVGIGLLVGFSVRFFGKGVGKQFGLVRESIAFFYCCLGGATGMGFWAKKINIKLNL